MKLAVPVLSGIVAAGIILGIMWPIMGDPAAIFLPIWAALIVGIVIGGVIYLSMNPRQ